MGKAKHFKRLRREAMELPAMAGTKTVGLHKTGAELIAEGVTEINGVAVNPKLNYTGRGKQSVSVNHLNNFKQSYYKKGIMGVEAYKGAINEIAERQAAQVGEK